MCFFVINGNYDFVCLFIRFGGKVNFLVVEGNEICVVSLFYKDCISGKVVYCSDGVKEWGYKEIVNVLVVYGF